jgi:Domain of unknown function (DUF4351)
MMLNEGFGQSRDSGERMLVLRLLTRRLGDLPDEIRSQIEQLPLSQRESLGEALLDFKAIADLENWLAQNFD